MAGKRPRADVDSSSPPRTPKRRRRHDSTSPHRNTSEPSKKSHETRKRTTARQHIEEDQQSDESSLFVPLTSSPRLSSPTAPSNPQTPTREGRFEAEAALISSSISYAVASPSPQTPSKRVQLENQGSPRQYGPSRHTYRSTLKGKSSLQQDFALGKSPGTRREQLIIKKKPKTPRAASKSVVTPSPASVSESQTDEHLRIESQHMKVSEDDEPESTTREETQSDGLDSLFENDEDNSSEDWGADQTIPADQMAEELIEEGEKDGLKAQEEVYIEDEEWNVGQRERLEMLAGQGGRSPKSRRLRNKAPVDYGYS